MTEQTTTTSTAPDERAGAKIILHAWNLLNGGIDGDSEDRRLAQVERMASWSPDILWVTEAAGWHRDAGRRFAELAAATGMVHLTPVTSRVGDGYNHSVLYYRPGRVQAGDRSGLLADGSFHHGCLRAPLTVDGVPILFLGTHLSYTSGDARLAEARYLADYGGPFGDWPEDRVLMADMNCPDHADTEPGSWDEIPANLLHRYCRFDEAGDIVGYDREARHVLMRAGWRDPQASVAAVREPTTGHWYDNEKVPMRLDQAFVTGPRLTIADYRTHVDAELDRLSDHRPVELVLRLGQPASAEYAAAA